MKYLVLTLVPVVYFALMVAVVEAANKYADKWWLAYRMAGYEYTMYLGPYDTEDACRDVGLGPELVFMDCVFR